MYRYVIRRLRNKLRGLLQTRGSTRLRSGLWDREFAGGRWANLLHTPGDCVYPVLEKHCDHGRILDLGCGVGSTGNELATACYGTYVGVDISGVAVRMAVDRTVDAERKAKNRYCEGDIVTFEPPDPQYNVILFRDSLYYIPVKRIGPLLHRYSRYLGEKGVFIVRIFGRQKYWRYVRFLERNFAVVETHTPDDGLTIVLVLRPAASARAPVRQGQGIPSVDSRL